MPEPTLTGLKVLREVAARGSFTSAAENLGYTQSSVSRQVAALEAAAGTPLFERAARGVRLSPAGQVLLRHAIGIIDQLESARHELAGLREPLVGSLRIGAFPTAAAALVPRAMAAFHARHAEIELTLREGVTPVQFRKLGAGRIELAVISTVPNRPPEQGRFTLEPLLDDPLLLAVSREHPFAGRNTVELDELADERWIASNTELADTFLGALDTPGWRPRVAFVIREWTAKLGLVAAGIGVTIVPGIAATSIRGDVALVRVVGSQLVTRQVVLARRADSEPTPHARAFAELLRDTATELTVDLRHRIAD
jgi:DNA-binding transcriptional LysR family regulator